MKFRCERYPELLVKGDGYRVQFADGEAEVTGKNQIDGLKALPERMGVRAVGGRPAKESE